MLFNGVLVATLVLCLFEVSTSRANDQVLLVISLDGFRPDYFDRGLTPVMNKMRECGTVAPYIVPVFPTKTYVNHFSIATGLYAGSHGVLGNKLYDSELGNIAYSSELFHQNPHVTPIWTLNEQRGKHTGCMSWPGSNFKYRNVHCTFTGQYLDKLSREDQMNTIISWIKHAKTPANFVMWYVDQPDDTSHAFGPDSRQVESCKLLVGPTTLKNCIPAAK